LFVGSFNLNQRSIYLNTEIGLLIDSPVLAGQVAEGIIALLRPENSWSLELDRQGRLRWLAADGVVVSHDPQTSAWRRAKVWLLSLLPAVEYF
jgi:putative cardiolipin synthase